VTTVGVEMPHRNRAYERFLPEGPLAVLPRPGARVAVVWTLPPAHAAALRDCPDDVFIGELQQAFGWRLGALANPGKRQVHGLRRVRVDDPVAHRVAVVGNAAHTLHPVAGQGFNLALRDCAALAETIHLVRSQGADPGREVALRRYANWRRRDTRGIEWFTDGLLRLFASRLPPLVAGRDLAMCAIDLLPMLKRPLLRRTMGFGGHVPRLSRGLPLVGSRRGAA
jgi:2-octaprenyl-6-methoxyphenol hydroxylase